MGQERIEKMHREIARQPAIGEEAAHDPALRAGVFQRVVHPPQRHPGDQPGEAEAQSRQHHQRRVLHLEIVEILRRAGDLCVLVLDLAAAGDHEIHDPCREETPELGFGEEMQIVLDR